MKRKDKVKGKDKDKSKGKKRDNDKTVSRSNLWTPPFVFDEFILW